MSSQALRQAFEVFVCPTPTSCVEVLRFLGLANYFRQYIERFSELAALLSSLTGHLATFRWGDTKQRSFESLKQALCLVPVLSIWQPGHRAWLTTNASEVVTSVAGGRGVASCRVGV